MGKVRGGAQQLPTKLCHGVVVVKALAVYVNYGKGGGKALNVSSPGVPYNPLNSGFPS